MTQFQFDMICKIIDQGAPALAMELCSALEALVRDCNALVAENEQLKTRIEALTTDAEPAVTEEVADN